MACRFQFLADICNDSALDACLLGEGVETLEHFATPRQHFRQLDFRVHFGFECFPNIEFRFFVVFFLAFDSSLR